MVHLLFWIIGSSLVVSAISLIGVFFFAMKRNMLKKMLLIMVGFSAGSLMGGAFLHLLPEALENTKALTVFTYTLIAFAIFFVIERFLHWHHCHEGKCNFHAFTYMNLIGDSIHNFIDGMIIAGSYIVNVPFGIITTIAVIAHEIPQEIGDFAVLLYGGFKRAKALMFNLLSALTAVIGAIVGYFISSSAAGFTDFLVPFAAGGFIYIAASDLVPEIHKTNKLKESAFSFALFVLGVLFVWIFKMIFSH